ncbi:cell division protein FtsQ/DivIB [Sporofaciens sp. SGI.106]|uniref:cell division protein FtsQ/DivIB n=1 Tax=Sporofaciens sp. SGI.106 TaxID=3420568 RepID=UPI002A922D4F|nr:hypothetical protein [Lachnoclostridium sp.]
MSGQKKMSHKIYALVVIVLGIIIFALSFFLLFYVQKMEVSGNEYTESQAIIDVVKKDPCSVNSLYLYGKYRLKKDTGMPGSLDAVKVSLKAPWSVNIKVTEKEIVGYILADEGYAYFDKDGTVVLESLEVRENVPFIQDLEVEEVTLYKTLKCKDEKLLKAVLDVTKELQNYELTPDKITCTDSGVCLYFENICVSLGKKVTSDKMAQIAPILAKLSGQTGTLHLEHYEDEGSGTITFKVGELPGVEPQEPAPTDEQQVQEEGTGDEEDGYYDESYGEYYDESYDEYYDESYDESYNDGYGYDESDDY